MGAEGTALTDEQRDQILATIKTHVVPELGPLIKDVVEERMKNLTPVQPTFNLAQMLQAAAAKDNPTKGDDRGLMFGRLIRCLAANKGDVDKAQVWATKEWGADDDVHKALSAGSATAGGFIVPPAYSEQIIELLSPKAIVRSFGPLPMPLESGTAQVPKLTAGTSAEYVGENADIGETDIELGMIALVAKKLATLVPVSNDLLRWSRPQADTIVRNDLVRAMRIKEDITFIRSDGTAFTPKGIKYWMASANQLTCNATVNLANVTTDLGRLLLQLVNADVGMDSPGWMMAPRTWNYLMTLRDANGNFAFREEMKGGTLWGFPYKMTTQIPINLSVTGSNESELYLVDFADVVLGEALTLTIDVSTEASYVSSGTLVSAFSRDQTVIRVIAEHDLVMRHDASAAMLTDVDWGV